MEILTLALVFETHQEAHANI